MKIRKLSILVVVCLLMMSAVSGCKPSKKKVESSSYYKELNKKYKKLKKENKELKEELESRDQPTEDEQRAADYLAKIARDRIISIEVGYADNMKAGELITNNVVFSAATAIAKRADLTSKYTPDEVRKKYGPGYEYILYDEDNAVYEVMVYGGDYVVFTDLPNNVYYSCHASMLGDAFLQYRNGYPASRILHRIADSPLVTNNEKYFENDSAFRAANYIRTKGWEKSSRKKADKEWLKIYQEQLKKKKDENASGSEKDTSQDSPEGEEGADAAPDPSVYEPEGEIYTFYHHGNILTMTIYDKYISIRDIDEKETWYKVEKDEIEEFKKLFVVPEEETVYHPAQSGKSDEAGKQSHEKEIETESDVSRQEE